MGQAYTPGLKVTDKVRHRVRRLLPVPGEVLVAQGAAVEAETVVARALMPGDVMPVNMANQLGVSAGDVRELMLVKEGDAIEVGQEIARTKGLFGFMKSSIPAKVAGTIETISDVTGQMIVRGDPLPVEVKAYMAGTVAEVLPGEGCVVENDVCFVQGIFGVGGEISGEIAMAAKSPEQELVADMITPDMKGKVVVGGARVWHEAIQRARSVGAAAVIAGGIDDQDLKEILGYDLGVAVTGSEEIGLTIVITEGFGDIRMAGRTFRLLHDRAGREASVNGATQIRAGVMRPEIIVPVRGDEPVLEHGPAGAAGQLEIGRTVRIIRDPWFGLIGDVAGLPPEPATLGSGSRSRVLDVRLASGETVTVPRANVELIEA